MSNLPPGVTAGHPYFNPPDRSHEHRWEDGELILEDGAAIFYEKCCYAEGRRGDEWTCDETRTTRLDVEKVVVKGNNTPDIAYLSNWEDNQNEWRYIERVFEDALVSVEIRFINEGDNILNCDPPTNLNDGFVRAECENYEVWYVQDT